MGRKYALGIDYGSLSGRALLVDVADGREVATTVDVARSLAVAEGRARTPPQRRAP